MVRSYKTRPNVRPRRFQMVSDSLADYRSAAYQAVRSKAPQAQARRAVTKPSFVRQLKALVAGKKKDAADVSRGIIPAGVNTFSSTCLTVTSGWAAPGVAASGTGLLDMDGDSCLINSVKFRGSMHNTCQLLAAASASEAARLRVLTVWFNKPLLVPSAAGTLPPVTEVLITDDINSEVVTNSANAGRFTILKDKIYNLGVNTIGAAAASVSPRVNGTTYIPINETLRIGKTCHFAVPSVSGTPAGHYDSDVGPGRIDKGLLVMYIATDADSGVSSTYQMNTRLNYTG